MILDCGGRKERRGDCISSHETPVYLRLSHGERPHDSRGIRTDVRSACFQMASSARISICAKTATWSGVGRGSCPRPNEVPEKLVAAFVFLWGSSLAKEPKKHPQLRSKPGKWREVRQNAVHRRFSKREEKLGHGP